VCYNGGLIPPDARARCSQNRTHSSREGGPRGATPRLGRLPRKNFSILILTSYDARNKLKV